MKRFIVPCIGALLFLASAAGRAGDPTPGQQAIIRQLKKWNGRVNLTTAEFGCHSHLPDAGLALLAQLPDLESADIISDAITDKGLAHLKALPHLRNLGLNSGKITSEGMLHLRGTAGTQGPCWRSTPRAPIWRTCSASSATT